MQASEAAKRAGTKDINYSVAPGRSGRRSELRRASSADMVDIGGGI
jgi:hypothetical protein